MIKVRFHLGKGPNFMKWQIKEGNNKSYIDPNRYSLFMENCKIVNRVKISEAIFKGANKKVCGWIECKKLSVFPSGEISIFFTENLKFNPQVNPYWVYYALTLKNGTFSQIKTYGNKLHAII